MTDNFGAGLETRTDSSLSKKVSKGTLWVTAASISARALNLVSAIILARLLAPSDFGLMAIAMAIISFSQGTTQTGFESALIQKQNRPEEFLNTAWTFELVRYLVLFFIIFLAAPLFASFFKEPRATAILRVISISLVFQGLRNIGVVYFRKNLDFHKQFVLEIVPLAAYIAVVIPLAFSLRNVWALVWASLVTSMATCMISYIMHPYRPRLDLNLEKAKILFNFGKWIFGASILVMIREQGITMFVGKLLGISILGFYNRAGAFSIMLFRQLVEIVWKVGYPVYSQLQTDRVRLKQAYLETSQLLSFIGMPMAGGLFVIAGDFVSLFLTDKWLPIVPLIQILCLQAIVGFANAPAGILFQAIGRPSIGTKISFIGIAILIILVYPLSLKFGITGTVFSLLLSVLITSPIIWHKAIQIMNCTYFEFFRPILFSLFNTGIMVFTISTIKKNVFDGIYIVDFFFLIMLGIVIYFTLSFFIDKSIKYGTYALIKERFVVWK